MPKASQKPAEKPAQKPAEKPTPRLVNVMKDVSNILAEYPDSVSVVRVHDEHGYYYKWVKPKSKARNEIRNMLLDLWRRSTDRFNYQVLANRLRLKIEDVQALLDEDFRLDNGL